MIKIKRTWFTNSWQDEKLAWVLVLLPWNSTLGLSQKGEESWLVEWLKRKHNEKS